MEGYEIGSKQRIPEADVVFLLDGSKSMYKIIDKVRKGVELLYQRMVLTGFQLRFKVIAYDWKTFLVSDFIKDPSLFREKLEKVLDMIASGELGGDEFTLPALDWALDSEWQYRRRVIILLTDECLSKGKDPEFQWYGHGLYDKPIVEKLKEKISLLKVRLVLIGLNCPGKNDYNTFMGATPFSLHIRLANKDKFASIETTKLVDLIEKSISSSQVARQTPPSVGKDIYNLEGKIKIRRI